MPWPWPSEPPALVFAEDELGPWQKQMVKMTYGDETVAARRDEIFAASRVRAYAKPLLAALVLDVLARKACALIRSADGLGDADKEALCDGVRGLRDVIARTAGTGEKDFVVTLLAVMARAVSLFRRGSEPPSLSIYEHLTMQPASQVATGPAVDSDGVRELAVCLALLSCGVVSAGWRLDVSPTATGGNGALRVTESSGAEHAVFLAVSGHAALELARRGVAGSAIPDAVVIRCDDPGDPSARSPSVPPGRTGATAGAEVAIRQLVRDSSDLEALHRAFCLQAGLAA
jgi:hypothetical protein